MNRRPEIGDIIQLPKAKNPVLVVEVAMRSAVVGEDVKTQFVFGTIKLDKAGHPDPKITWYQDAVGNLKLHPEQHISGIVFHRQIAVKKKSSVQYLFVDN